MIKRTRLCTAVAAAGICVTSAASLAADMPVKAPPRAMTVDTGGWYFWIDGSHQRVGLPVYDLGVRVAVPAPFAEAGPLNSHNQRANGWGISGALGFRLPPGAFPSIGTNTRFEVGGSFVDANAKTTTTGGNATSFAFALLNGRGSGQFFGIPLSATSTLDSNYQAWSIQGKLLTDFTTGAHIVTPSVAVFGGHGRNNQNFSQNMGTAVVPLPVGFLNYTANTSLDWTDWGARAGMDARIGLTDRLGVGLGGSIGVARREASLAGNDRCSDIVGITCTFGGLVTSSVSTSAAATPFLANAEASLHLKMLPTVQVRGFVGLNYDSRVPGVRAPGPMTVNANGAFTTPARIKFESETSWYAGGGLTVSFGGPVVAR